MRIDGQLPGLFTYGEQLNGAGSALLESLSKGDVINAQILDMKMGEMVLRLADGSTIKAASKVQLKAEIGEFVSFAYKEKVNGKVILETLKTDTFKAETIKSDSNAGLTKTRSDHTNSDLLIADSLNLGQEHINLEIMNSRLSQSNMGQSNTKTLIKSDTADHLTQILKGMGIDPDESSLMLAKSIIDQGLSLSKESYKTIWKLVSGQPEITTKKLIFLLANGLEPDENNIEILNQIADGKMKSGQLVQKLADAVLKALEHDNGSELLNNLINDIRGLPVSLKEVTREEFPYELDKLKKQLITKITPENLIPSQLEKLQIIRRNLPSVPAILREEIQTLLNDMEKAIDFYKEVSKQHYFYQVPIYLSEKASNSEIYIMKNREGTKRFGKNGLTAYISLETERMGEVDAFVSMSGKTIEIQFRAENSEAVEIIKEHSIDLHRILMDKGYKLANCSCKLKDTGDSVSIVDAGEQIKTLRTNKRKPVDIKI